MSFEETMEVITLDDSEVDNSLLDSSADVQVIKEIRENVPNLSIANETVVSFDATLPPGVAPEGFLIVDEEITKTSTEPEVAPIFRITFRDPEAFQNYHEQIKDFLKDLLESRYDKDESSAKDLAIEIFDSDETPNDLPVEGPAEKPPIDFYFTLDSEPNATKEFDVPAYGKKFSKTLEKGTAKATEEKNENSAPKMTCFNCLGNHSMRDCPKPRNYNEITKNRKDYYNVRRVPSNARYHTDEDQKFGHFVPGQVTPKLRKALGIKDNELPRYIYRMRMLGYPPGWLEEARLQHSGLSLFNSNGVADQNLDEGEIVSPGDKDQYDIKKIIDFPGFNVPLLEGTKDEYMHYWGSIEQLNFSKETMKAQLSHKKTDDGYKRKKFPNPASFKPQGNINPGEMEIESVEETPVESVPVKDLFVPPLPKEDGSEFPPPPPPEDNDSRSQEDTSNSESNAPSSGTDSPTLFDLECAKKQLLAALNDSSPQPNPVPEKIAEPAVDSSIENANLDSSKIEDPNPDSSQPGSLNTSSIKCETPKASPVTGSGHKSVKSVHIGTPILQSCSPYRRLPTSEKFSKNICDVINFENLPDSTGKYDQMTELLQKVRRTLSDLHNE
ncbi:zinc finger CCHC domain-containing protein 8 homolog [Copidosoma floridanum]|uniref:zinc finger CCHC domain-containing protein 8 homolog n=1 Tax=Copidosoma floridanum TaxID=29053 RepID=UPI0006C9D48B|nr:zinc finger CCHC domain-containing protein 8 homolog [Copidosoma floridanum]